MLVIIWLLVQGKEEEARNVLRKIRKNEEEVTHDYIIVFIILDNTFKDY